MFDWASHVTVESEVKGRGNMTGFFCGPKTTFNKIQSAMIRDADEEVRKAQHEEMGERSDEAVQPRTIEDDYSGYNHYLPRYVVLDGLAICGGKVGAVNGVRGPAFR